MLNFATVEHFTNLGISGILIFFVLFFIFTRFWPWFTKEYWPEKQRQASKMIELIQGIRDSLTALRVIQERQDQNMVLILDKVNRLENEQISIHHQMAIITSSFGHKGNTDEPKT